MIGQSETLVRMARRLNEELEAAPDCKELPRRLLESPPTLLVELSLPLALGQHDDLFEPIVRGGLRLVFDGFFHQWHPESCVLPASVKNR